jgi:hypothetical protein
MADKRSGTIPVLQVVREAYAFAGSNWRQLAPAAVAAGVLTALGQGLLFTPAGFLPGTLVIAIASAAFGAAVLRLAVRNEFSGLFGLQTGADELRLLGVMAALVLVFAPPVGILLLLAGVFILGRLGLTEAEAQELSQNPEALAQRIVEALGPQGVLALEVGLFAVVALFLWIGARLQMVNAATIGERRMVVFQTWSWSRGETWRIIGALIIVSAPVLLVGLVAEPILSSLPGSALVVGSAVAGALSALASLPAIALGAILYRGLRPPDFQPR